MKKLTTLLTVLLTSTCVKAFSVPDHKLITELAITELNECGILPVLLRGQDDGQSSSKNIIDANAEEDNYLKNGIKKLFIYSHFYNPLRPLKKELLRAHHADSAVEDYSEKILKRFNNNDRINLSKDNQKEIGKIIHLIQDASSAPHVMWINHATGDGFENKVHVSKFELEQNKLSCAEISMAGLKSPIEVMKAAGLSTLKELDNSFEFVQIMDDGSEPKIQIAPWTQTFFSNNRLFTQNVLSFLRTYNYLSPNLNSPNTDDSGNIGWDLLKLGRGEYGPFSSEIKNVTIRGDNFGNTRIFSVGGKKYKVELSEYVKLKKTLMRQAILSTQRTILWLNSL